MGVHCSAVLTAHASKTCTFFSTTLEPNYCPKRKTKNKNYDFGKFCLNTASHKKGTTSRVANSEFQFFGYYLMGPYE